MEKIFQPLYMFHLPTQNLLSDAEVWEDVAEDFVGGDFAACDFGEVEEGFADVLSYEVGWNIHL